MMAMQNGDQAPETGAEEATPPQSNPAPHFDRLIAVVAILVSAISVLIAWNSSKTESRLVEADSMPFLTYSLHSQQVKGQRSLSLHFTNGGVGPADVRTVQVSLDGKPIRDLAELMKACCNAPDSSVNRVSLMNQMLRPGDDVSFINMGEPLTDRVTVDNFLQLAKSDRLVTRVCYCSVFSECWTLASSAARTQRPQRAKECPIPAVEYR